MQVATMVDGKSATDKSGQDADRQMQVSKAGVSSGVSSKKPVRTAEVRTKVRTENLRKPEFAAPPWPGMPSTLKPSILNRATPA